MSKTWTLTVVAFLSTLAVLVAACHCGGEPAQPAPDDPTPEAVTEAEAEVLPGPSAEVQAVIDAGDATAIAADMERLAVALADRATATGEAARSLEQVAEGMTGREKALDPRDIADITVLTESATTLIQGTTEMGEDIAELRQLVLDLRAEANALYGRPAE